MHDVRQWGPYLQALQGGAGERVRIRPAAPGDVEPILAMHQRLSADSLFLRYLAPAAPLRLAEHIQAICSRPAGEGIALVAECGAQVVGLGYYVVKVAAPETAEPALLVEDRYQGQGIGGRLMERLVAAARAQGVRYFDALAHSSNRPMLHLLRRSGQTVHSQLYGSEVTLRLALAGGRWVKSAEI